ARLARFVFDPRLPAPSTWPGRLRLIFAVTGSTGEDFLVAKTFRVLRIPRDEDHALLRCNTRAGRAIAKNLQKAGGNSLHRVTRRRKVDTSAELPACATFSRRENAVARVRERFRGGAGAWFRSCALCSPRVAPDCCAAVRARGRRPAVRYRALLFPVGWRASGRGECGGDSGSWRSPFVICRIDRAASREFRGAGV